MPDARGWPGRPAGAGGVHPDRSRHAGPAGRPSPAVSGPLRPQHHGPGRGLPHRADQARRRGRGAQHARRYPARGERRGQRRERERMVLLLGAGQQHQRRARRDGRPRGPVQGPQHRPRQAVLDVDAVGVGALIGVDGGERRAAHLIPGADDAPAGQHAVQDDPATFGVGGPGRGDHVGHVPFGCDGFRIAGLNGPGGVGCEHAQADQVQHAAQPGDILLAVTAVAAGLSALRPDAVPAVPRAQRRLRDAEVLGHLPRGPR